MAPKLTKSPSMRERVEDTLSVHRNELVSLLSRYVAQGKCLLQPHHLIDGLENVIGEDKGKQILSDGPFSEVLRSAQEAIVVPPFVAIAIRPRPGVWEYVRVNVYELNVEQLTVSEYLRFKEQLVDGKTDDHYVLELDFEPFTESVPRPTRSSSIGNGVQFLNRHLSSIMFRNKDCLEPLLNFLRMHKHKGLVMMLNDRIQSISRLQSALSKLRIIYPSSQQIHHTQNSNLYCKAWVLKEVGVILQPESRHDASSDGHTSAPDPSTLETFLGRLPMVFNVVILSIHGYFGQAHVLGLPDTGGQIVYILDQVRALEHEMVERIKKQGLDVTPRILIVSRLIPDAKGTTCNQRLERVSGTEHASILRVPFRSDKGILRKWISRFDVWPYLERFTEDAASEIIGELQGRPDLIIGNYSDGNIVASLLSHKMGVTQCNIAHALEKTKYPDSDIYWKKLEDKYHFSGQVQRDLMHDPLIYSYEYYKIAERKTCDNMRTYGFTCRLYRVVMDESRSQSYSLAEQTWRSISHFRERETAHCISQLYRRALIRPEQNDEHIGILDDPSKPIIFSMARLDRVKNITGLVECYGKNAKLREQANLVVVAGYNDVKKSNDREEIAEIEKMHNLINEYNLKGQFRWIASQTNRVRNGELYRYICDKRGIFVQPAFYEAFGLTVVEAMTCGLPTFATCHGGPAEIIEDGVSGFHIDPYHADQAADKMSDFFEKCREDPSYWYKISEGGLQRIMERYTWQKYSERLMTLAGVYGFWKYVSKLERRETRRYLEMFYILMFRDLAKSVPLASDDEATTTDAIATFLGP
uniref:Sucrose synthase n=1 Tax=Amaranthus hypochondriacus TaxID=28502 RepID=J9WR78_AMAHP|nr:sucrose synthase 2 [Amaranthus hypochondriacus]